MSTSGFLLDSNAWIALSFSAHPGHRAASDAMMSLSEENPAVFCRATQQSFLRLVTTAALANQYGVAGLTNDDALLLLDRFLASPITVFREEPPGLFAAWRRLASRPTAAPRLWMDAYLAAFAITGELGIMTLDRDFAAFEQSGLEVRTLAAY